MADKAYSGGAASGVAAAEERARQERIATLEHQLADALRLVTRLRGERARWAAEADRLRVEVNRLTQRLNHRSERRLLG